MKSGTAWTTCPCSLTASTGPVITGTNGFRLDGASANDYVGRSVATGDVDNDDKSDIIIGASQASYDNKAGSGTVYVVFGGATRKGGTAWAATQQLATTCSGHGCVALVGETTVSASTAPRQVMPWAMPCLTSTATARPTSSSARQGTYNGKANSGSTYLYPGHASPWTSPYGLGNLVCPG